MNGQVFLAMGVSGKQLTGLLFVPLALTQQGFKFVFTMGLVLVAEAGGGVFVHSTSLLLGNWPPRALRNTVTHPSALGECRGSSFRVSHKPLVGVTATTVVGK